MINDIYASLISITEGIHKDKRNERDYKDLNNNIKNSAAYKTPPLFTISFAEKDFGAKRKYYKKLIDNETCNKFNELIDSFPENAIEHEHIFNYQKIFDQYKHHLRNVDNYIKKYNFHRDSIQEENTFVIQYLKTNMIWLYLELQERFAEYGEEDRFTVEEINKYYFNEIIKEIEIIPNTKTEAIISPKKEVPIFIPISNDLTHRPLKTNIMCYDIIVKESKSLSRAEQMMFEAGIIDKDYNFISNVSRSNKSILGIIYFLFIQKGYFNPIKTEPFKKIKSTDIIKFLNNRYNTDARKQFKNFENDSEKRNELINIEYILQNLPNKIR
ncbi:protein of unknown function [Tenacibaculum soleae]|uniref:DUF6617 family protein n=1 Tax=Tenacibaculum soleae TaxID=447689 RepID=UPI003AB6DA94